MKEYIINQKLITGFINELSRDLLNSSKPHEDRLGLSEETKEIINKIISGYRQGSAILLDKNKSWVHLATDISRIA